MQPCDACGSRVARGATSSGRIVVIDYDQAVYVPVKLKERTELVLTNLALAVHKCDARD